MKNLLHHLNWTLYYISKAGWWFIRAWLWALVGLGVFLGIPFLVVKLTGNFDYAIFSMLPLIIVFIFTVITYQVYKKKPEEPVFLYDPEYNVGMYDSEPEEPKTLKQSIKEGFWWTSAGIISISVFIVLAVLFNYFF